MLCKENGLLSWRSRLQFRSVPWPMLSSGGQQGWFSGDPVPVFFWRTPLWAVLAMVGMSTLWCPSSISSVNHGVAHPLRCSEGWFWRGCHDVWRAWTMQVSISWQCGKSPSKKYMTTRFSLWEHVCFHEFESLRACLSHTLIYLFLTTEHFTLKLDMLVHYY